jgi:hypothetical protein
LCYEIRDVRVVADYTFRYQHVHVALSSAAPILTRITGAKSIAVRCHLLHTSSPAEPLLCTAIRRPLPHPQIQARTITCVAWHTQPQPSPQTWSTWCLSNLHSSLGVLQVNGQARNVGLPRLVNDFFHDGLAEVTALDRPLQILEGKFTISVLPGSTIYSIDSVHILGILMHPEKGD